MCIVYLSDGGVGFAHSLPQLSPNRHPFRGFEIVVLEEDKQRGAAEQRCVLSVELRSAVFGCAVGGRLVVWVTDNWGDEGWLMEGGCWSRCGGCNRRCISGETMG